MRWTPGTQSDDVEDRRAEGGGGGGFGGMRLGLGGVLVVGALSLLFRHNFFADLPQSNQGTPVREERPRAPAAGEDQLVSFVNFAIDDIQGSWDKVFAQDGRKYQHAKLVLFSNAIRSGCGAADSAAGPFYCPADRKAYIDLSFYRDLKRRFGAPGDFAQAYVIAHEIGHHVQNLLGIEAQMRRAQRESPSDGSELSVKLELQADCFAGIWGHSTEKRQLLEAGDLEEALNCAAAIGDDRLQKQATGRVNPETFTHGSSAQRMRWFKRGYDSGRIESCDTFQARSL